MESHVSKEGDVHCVALSGSLDPVGASQLKKVFAPLVAEPNRIVVDFGQVDYTGSAGLRELFLAAKNLERVGGKFMVCNLQPQVKQIFEFAGFAIPYPIYGTREEAMSVASASAA